MKRLVHVLAHLLALWAISSALHAEVRYRVTPIYGPDSNGQPTLAGVFDLNEKGELAVTAVVGGKLRPFLWQRGELTALGTLSENDASAWAYGINNRTQVVGTIVSAAHGFNTRGFLWQRGDLSDIGSPPPGDHRIVAKGINERGQILGSGQFGQGDGLTTTEIVNYTFIWQRGAFRELGLGALGGINDLGVVCGTVGSAMSSAAIWRNGHITQLGTLPSTERSVGLAINNRNHVVGYAIQGNMQSAFLWAHGALSALPSLYAGSSSSAWAINDRDQVVGLTGGVATLWEHGVAYDLNQLIDDRDPLKAYVSLEAATLINNRGQIVAQGSDSSAPFPPRQTVQFLLTPTTTGK